MYENKNKHGCFMVFVIILLLVIGFWTNIVYAGTLSCSVTTAAACTSPSVVILRMSGSGNAHAELPSQSTAAYANYVVCCGGVTNLSNSCSDSYTTVLKLSGTSNAHVQQSGLYSQSACISIPSGTAPTVAYVAGDQSCTPTYDDTLLSMSAASNAHVGNETAYNAASNYKICATAAGAAAPTLTFSFPGGNSVALGTLSATAVRTGSHTILVGTNATNGVVVTYSGSTLTSGGNTITAMSTAAASSVGTEQFGINAKDNATPNVGLECSGTPPIAAAATGYATIDNFKFVSGETIISSAGSINDTTCTISYIANITAATEAGSYSATLTYIATGNF